MEGGRSFNSTFDTVLGVLCISDSSEFALAGFYVISKAGFAWRSKLLPNVQNVVSLTLLE